VTVERGRDWGRTGALPAGAPVVAGDAELRSLVERARRAGRDLPTVGLTGGDLCRTLGGTGDAERLRTDQATTVTVDVGSVLVDGRLHWFVAHLVARRSWWRGPILAAMNAEWLGRFDVAPRAHPGDGLLDVVEADPSLPERLKAWRRLPTGAHLPHPDIRQRRLAALQVDLDPPATIRLDGEVVGTAGSLSVRVEPDALTVVV